MPRTAEPITILTGLGFPTSIRHVRHAYAILNDWRHSQRGSAHAAALRACRAALDGETDEAAALAAFMRFADHAGVLVSSSVPRNAQAVDATTHAGSVVLSRLD